MNTRNPSIQPHYTIVDAANRYPASQSRLLLCIAPTSISIAVYDPDGNTLCSLKKYLEVDLLSAEHLEELFLQEQLVQFHYQSYHVSLFSPSTFLMPISDPFDEDGDYRKEDIQALRSTIYYQFQRPIIDFLKAKFNYSLSSSSAALLNALILRQNKLQTPNVYANCVDKHLEIIAFDHEKLLLHNIFQIEQPEDFSYFILSIYESLNFSTAKVPTTLIGTISKPSRIYDLLFTYIKDVQFIKKFSAINYNSAFEDIEDHIIYPIACILKP